MSIYIEENIFSYEGKSYEKLFDHPYNEKFRVIFDEDDYDYIEDLSLIQELEKQVAIK
jgi:hypothetical protein